MLGPCVEHQDVFFFWNIYDFQLWQTRQIFLGGLFSALDHHSAVPSFTLFYGLWSFICPFLLYLAGPAFLLCLWPLGNSSFLIPNQIYGLGVPQLFFALLIASSPRLYSFFYRPIYVFWIYQYQSYRPSLTSSFANHFLSSHLCHHIPILSKFSFKTRRLHLRNFVYKVGKRNRSLICFFSMELLISLTLFTRLTFSQ